DRRRESQCHLRSVVHTALVRYIDFRDSYLAGAELSHPTGANKLDPLRDSEAVRPQERLGRAVARRGEEFERPVAIGLAGHACGCADEGYAAWGAVCHAGHGTAPPGNLQGSWCRPRRRLRRLLRANAGSGGGMVQVRALVSPVLTYTNCVGGP